MATSPPRTSTSTSPSATAAQARRPEARPLGQKSNITRVRTGCFTCRKRKKKCDEKRPTCLNCQKTGIICEGYPQQVYWENRAAARRPSEASISTPQESALPQKHPQMGSKEAHREPDLIFIPGGQPPMLDPFPQPMVNAGYDFINDSSLDFMFDNLEEASMLSGSDGGAASVASMMPTTDTLSILMRPNPPPSLSIPVPNLLHYDYIPNELPFLIPGVKTQLHRRLFCHFTGVLATILSPTVQGGSPFNIVVIPVAMRDATVMNTLLSLAGSHIMKTQPGDGNLNTDLDIERQRLHSDARAVQTTRFQNLKASFAAGGSCNEQDQEVIFTTCLLLLLYEISEGSGADTWRQHLDMAREVLVMGSRRLMNAPLTPTSPTSPASPTHLPALSSLSQGNFIITDVHLFLLEFFQYHDAVANVTVASPVEQPRFRSASNLEQHEPYMIGVRDGLVDFIFRIAALRAQANRSPHKPDGDVIIKAVAIWEELSRWKPRAGLAAERALLSEYYQWALFIWLFSVVYPGGRGDATVQRAVRRIAAGMHDLRGDEGVLACLLFPLFVVGSAAIDDVDRTAIRAHFRRLLAWNAFGNVGLAHRVVEKLWLDHDVGVPGAWDWVGQMEAVGITLMIT